MTDRGERADSRPRNSRTGMRIQQGSHSLTSSHQDVPRQVIASIRLGAQLARQSRRRNRRHELETARTPRQTGGVIIDPLAGQLLEKDRLISQHEAGCAEVGFQGVVGRVPEVGFLCGVVVAAGDAM